MGVTVLEEDLLVDAVGLFDTVGEGVVLMVGVMEPEAVILMDPVGVPVMLMVFVGVTVPESLMVAVGVYEVLEVGVTEALVVGLPVLDPL